MIGESLLSLAWPWGLWAGLLLALAGAAVVRLRRPAVPALTVGAALVGTLMLAMGAGGLRWERSAPQPIVVMVDLSPSTRVAEYRDREVLNRRIRELLGVTPYRLMFFSEDNLKGDPGTARLADVPADHTSYAPPAAAAVLLFSDCRFELPGQAPPTYIVVDPGLEDTDDASVANLEIRGNDVSVLVNNSGGPRRLTLTGAAGESPTTAPIGSTVVTRPLQPRAGKISAELSPGDPWPENDLLAAIVPSPQEAQRWWIGRTAPATDWRQMSPAELPNDPAAYLVPEVIVLENVAASELSDVQQQRLRQYVRDLGGGLVILGGDRSFAAGGYIGSTLDTLSPLASSPPQPTTHWVLLVDGSGSMASDAGGATRWQRVTDAVAGLLPHLPPEDLVSVGSFADSIHWWISGKPVRESRAIALPPRDEYPHGPTNLRPALEAVASSADGKLPVQLLVLSDFDATLSKPSELASLFRSHRTHLHLLAIGDGAALPALRKIADSTGGTVARQLDPARWTQSVRELAGAARGRQVETGQVDVTFTGEAALAGRFRVMTWDPVWVKESAAPLAEGRQAAEAFPIAAHWNAGEGQVLAVGFGILPDRVEPLARLVARPPHDPRFRVNWQTAPQLRVTIEAINGAKYLNGLRLALELTDAFGEGEVASHPILQSGPGRYELEVPAPRSPGVASVRAEGQVIGRLGMAGRYPPEFDAVGNNHPAMEELARRTGGQVVAPNRSGPLDIRWPRSSIPLASYLAAAGAALIALGLGWWRLH